MSAYFVEYSTIDNIISGIKASRYDPPNWISKHYLPASFNSMRSRIGKQLLLLNAKALKARYGDQIAKMRSDICKYKFTPRPHVSIFQFYKSLSCLHYQCCEGDIPETQLYKDMSKLLDQIAHHIVCEDSKYETATWG